MLGNWSTDLSLLFKQRRYLRRCPGTPMQQYLQGDFPSVKTDYREVEYLAVDLEMTGLDAARDHILSIGFVPVIQQKVIVAQAQHHYVSSDLGVGQSAVIHGIHDRDIHSAGSLTEALEALLEALRGRVMLLHCAPLDMAFLRRACRQLWGLPLLAPVADTMALEKYRLECSGKSVQGTSLRLGDTRKRYNLLDYAAHNALIDALSTAELFLAQMSHRFGTQPASLRQLLSPAR